MTDDGSSQASPDRQTDTVVARVRKLGPVIVIGFALLLGTRWYMGERPAQFPPCTTHILDECLEGHSYLKPPRTSPNACDAPGPRVCIVTVGFVPRWQVDELQALFSEEYGVDVRVLPAIDLPPEQLGPGPFEVNARTIASIAQERYQGIQHRQEAALLVLTPVDIWSDRPGSWVFGVKDPDPITWIPYGVVSTFRMNPRTFGEPRDDDLWMARIRKLGLKYAGMLYFGLPETDDPRSLLYRHISGLRSLDFVRSTLELGQLGE